MSNCRLKYATDIADKIKDFGNLDKTSAKKLQENQYLLPIGGFNGENTKLETVKNTYEWGKKIQTWANNRYKNVGNMVDLRNTEDGTILTIQIPKILIDAYENKFGQMTDEDFQAAMDAEEYYNEQNTSNISRGAKDPNIKAKYFKDSNVTTATTILDNIAKSGHSLNKLASKLIDFAKANNVKITLVKQIAKKEGDIVNSSAAVYNASTNTIEIREDASFIGYGSEPTIIHEILHALTYKQLRDNNTTSKEFNKLYEHAKQFFPEWNKETQKGEYAIANSDEFLVALFTDAAFINKLKTIPSTSKVGEYTNFFQEIYDYILSLFNINSSGNKNLKDSLYGQAFAVASNILVDFKERNQTNEFFQLNPNKVNANLKAVDILQSDKAKQVFEKGQKNNWPLDKILTELLIPKEQKQLLLELGITDREQLALELASQYSYTIEINTAKISTPEGNEESDFYSNLTVPGGTNYTENEISTPLITPSIKGHAQFSTDNGIGWFRSDEQNPNSANHRTEQEDFGTSYYYKNKEVSVGEYYSTLSSDYSKTRRILEVQSDLFQKGRDKTDLVNLEKERNTELDKKSLNGEITDEEYYAIVDDKSTIPKNSNSNQFLQLLNKDNNWVTFFIKSIIQDSAKKGYEKVLFPSGETAAKVEGHETLATELNKINKELKSIEDQFGNDEKEILRKEEAVYQDYIRLKTKKQELKSQGLEKLKPIEAFYENKITNILKKQGYNPTVITDEYGNTWNEITVEAKHLDTILFQNQVVKDTVSKKNELTETIFKGLEEYIKQNGIKVEFLDSLKAKYPNDPVAVYNHIRNTIEINKGEQTADTLAEELGHHLTLALGADHVLVKRALNLIGRIDYKSELGQAYVDAYKGDVNLLKMEYLGKLIAKTIVNGYENPLGTTENEIKIWDTIIAMLNKFISLFNPNSNITSELDKVAFELSSMITSGTKLDVQKSPIDNIMLFQLNAENTKETKKVSEDLRQEVFYKREIGRLKNEINSMIKKGLNTDSKEAELKKIKDGIAELEATKNKQILINLSTDTLNTIEEFINNLSDPSKQYEALNGERIENILTTLHIFEDFIPTAERSMRLLKDLKPHIKQYVLEHVNKYSGREVTMEDLDKRDTDLFVGEKGFGTLADVKNYIGKTIGYLIKDAQGKIERANKVSFNELEKEIEAIEKYASTAGIPKKDIYKIFIQEYKDRKGKLTTILAKEYTSAFYTAISDTFKLPTAEEGKAARQALGTWNKEKERWEPRNSAYINKDYIKIQNTPALKRYYDYYKKSIAALGEELPVNLNENFIPNLVEKSLLDIIKSDKSVGGKLKEGVMSILDIYDVEHEENAFISEEDLLLDTVPLKYIGGISPELKSSDLSSSLLKFMYFTNSYKEMSEILPKARLLQEQIKESSFIKNTDKGRSIKGEDTNLNSMVESFINMQIKGEMKKDEKLGDFNYSKYIDFGLKYTSLLRIGLNPFNAITNILVGNIGNIIESVGGRHFSYANYVKAREIFFKELGGDSKTNKLIEKYNPLMELEDYENLNKINIGSNEYKEKTKALMYAPQRLGEKYLQTSTMIASLLHDKVTTKDGKSISMWEAFDDNGVWKEELMGYPLTEDMIFKTTNKIQRINQMIHGRYSAKDAAALSQYSLFRMAFQFKKWIPAAIESRVQGRRFDDRLGVDTEGRYHTYMKFIQLNIAKLQGNKEKIESLKFDDTDLYNMRKNMMELVVVLSSTLMYIGLGWDDDDKKKGWYKFTMNQLDKVSGDMMFFYNPAEMNRNVGNTLPLIKSTGDLIKAFKATQYLLGGKNSEYTKGKHANENKAIAAYLDVTPIAKPIADVIRNFNGQKYQAPTGR